MQGVWGVVHLQPRQEAIRAAIGLQGVRGIVHLQQEAAAQAQGISSGRLSAVSLGCLNTISVIGGLEAAIWCDDLCRAPQNGSLCQESGRSLRTWRGRKLSAVFI